jgi:hypothetical protein
MHKSFQLPVEIQSRTWTRLLTVDRAAKKRFSKQVERGLACLGLRIAPAVCLSGYYCSPVNAIQFASNGAEAVFSFMIFAGQVSDATPIVLTCVGPGEQHNFIVGKSLHDFLCLGYHRGFFALEQMGYHLDQTLNRMTSGRWKPKDEFDWYNGFGVNDEQRPVLHYLRQRMRLAPWRNAGRKFAELQRTFLPHLELRSDLFSAGWMDDEFRAWKNWLK